MAQEKPPHCGAQIADSSDQLGKDSKPKEQQELNDEPTLGRVGDVSGDLGTDVVSFQSDSKAVGDGEDKADINQLDAWLASDQGQLHAGDPPLTPRQRKQRTKGLPDVENLRALARTCLEQAHQLYPDLVKQGIVPANTEVTIEAMVQSFMSRFVSGKPIQFEHDLDSDHYEGLAATYVRYSDDNSNPTSLDDQLALAMKRAASEKRYIPWEYVFADASITARTALRRGYVLAKDALEQFKDSSLDTLYIDDFSRASRTAIETYRLARLMEVLEHRLIGVSDGFDLDSKNSQIMMMAVAMLNEMFIAGLREKVLRGMKGAAERGTSLGLPPFGYKLVDKLDANGEPIITAKGTHLHIPAVDDEHKEHVIRAAKWFADDKLSYKEIARRFNDAGVQDKDNWTGSRISKMLANPMYAGVRIYNRTRTVWDKETGEFSRKPNPEDQWVVKEMPELRIIEADLWTRVRARADEVAAKSTRTGKKLDRNKRAMPECQVNDLYPTSIVDGVLFCGCCGRAMRLIHSKGDDKQYACPNGNNEIYGCTFRSSKSLNQIAAGLLPYIKEQVLDEEQMTELVVVANAYLAEEAAKPRVDLKPLRRALADVKREAKENIEFVRQHRNEFDMSDYLKLGEELNKKSTALQQQLREAEAVNAAPPPPIELDDVLGYLDDLRGLMDQNVQGSAHAVRALLGKVMVEEVEVPGRKRKAWIGHVNGDLVPLMAHASKVLQTPDSDGWAFLLSRIWKFRFSADVQFCETPAYVQYSEELKALNDNGVSVELIASRYGMSPAWVRKSIRFAKTGERPKNKSGRKTGKRIGIMPKYKRIADDVSRLKAGRMSFPKIITWLAEHRSVTVSEATVRRAWNYANPDAVNKAVDERAAPAERARYRHLSAETVERIEQMLAEGHSVSEIAKAAGCGKTTVRRVKCDS